MLNEDSKTFFEASSLTIFISLPQFTAITLARNTKEGSITVPLTSCLTGLD
jgi:hypothetical protein